MFAVAKESNVACPLCADPLQIVPNDLGAHCEGLPCGRCGVNARNRYFYYLFNQLLSERTGLSADGLLDDRSGSARKPQRILEASSFGLAALKQAYGDAVTRKFGQFLCSDYNQEHFRSALHVDLQNMDFPDSHFDMIAHTHVLEHVEDDVGAMRETYRCLVPDGVFLFAVPIQTDFTFKPVEPEYHGDNAFVFRRNGWDVIEKLKSVGFHVSVVVPDGHIALLGEHNKKKTDLAIDLIRVGEKFAVNFERYKELFYRSGSPDVSAQQGFSPIWGQLEAFVCRKTLV